MLLFILSQNHVNWVDALNTGDQGPGKSRAKRNRKAPSVGNSSVLFTLQSSRCNKRTKWMETQEGKELKQTEKLCDSAPCGPVPWIFFSCTFTTYPPGEVRARRGCSSSSSDWDQTPAGQRYRKQSKYMYCRDRCPGVNWCCGSSLHRHAQQIYWSALNQMTQIFHYSELIFDFHQLIFSPQRILNQ